MMKYITIMITGLLFLSCEKQDSIDTKNSVLTLDETEQTALNNWIKENYIEPYNIEILYNWQSTSTYDETLLYPSGNNNVQEVLEVAQKLWINLYKDELGDEIKDYLPISIKLFGGSNETVAGFEQLNILDASPMQMTLFRISEYQKDETHVRNLMRNIHNNYTKLLIWKKPFDREAFAKLNFMEYLSDAGQGQNIYTVSSIADLGFYSLPARRYNVEEDFAETVSMILCYPKLTIDQMIESAATPIFPNDPFYVERSRKAKATLEAKRDFVVKYFKEQYNINLYRLSYISLREMKELLN